MEQAATLGSAIIACTVINGRVGVILLYRHLVSQNPRTLYDHAYAVSQHVLNEKRGGGPAEISPRVCENILSALCGQLILVLFQGGLPTLAASRYQYVA